MENKIGIDLGGTKIEGVLLDENHTVIKRERVLTERENGYESIIQKIIELAQVLIASGDVKGPIGICTPGAIDPTSSKMKKQQYNLFDRAATQGRFGTRAGSSGLYGK